MLLFFFLSSPLVPAVFIYWISVLAHFLHALCVCVLHIQEVLYDLSEIDYGFTVSVLTWGGTEHRKGGGGGSQFLSTCYKNQYRKDLFLKKQILIILL